MKKPFEDLQQIIKRLEDSHESLNRAAEAIANDNPADAEKHIKEAREKLFTPDPEEPRPAWEKRAEDLGNQLIELLTLKTNENGRINTSWGDKTPLGLGLTIRRLVDDNRKAADHD